MNEMMEKIAQRRGLFNKLVRSPLSVKKHISKNFSPIYQEQYEKLELADDYIREITGPQGESLKELLKEIKTNNKAYRWLAVLDKAAKINYIAKNVISNEFVEDLIKGSQDYIKEFYFNEEDSKGRAVQLDQIHASEINETFFKQALFGDMSRRFTDKLLSGLHNTKSKEIKRQMNLLVNGADTLARKLFKVYDDLDSARASGDISKYVLILSLFKKDQQSYEDLYKKTYESVKDYLPAQTVTKPEDKPQEIQEDLTVYEKPSSVDPKVVPTADLSYYDIGTFPNLGTEVQEEKSTYEFPKPGPSPAPITGRPDDWEEIEKDVEALETASENDQFLILIKNAFKQNNRGLAASLLSHYSQYLEDNGNMIGSVKTLAIAEELINAK